MRQEWPEGFATAVHLAVDLRTGDFTLGNAGHPAPIQFTAGSGRWGLDRLLGNAERLITSGFAGGARRLCADAQAGDSDDRAVVVIWRD